MKVTVNGEIRELPFGTTIATLLEELGVTQLGIAVAKNDRVVRRVEYRSSTIDDGDAVEIIKAAAGG
jgi:sulfur carrier protein